MELLPILFDRIHTGVFLLFAGLLFIIMLIAVSCDLSSGVRRAKRVGEFRSSKKFRRTVEKTTNYGVAQLLCILMDAIINLAIHLLGIHWFEYPVPSITGLYTLYILFIEWRSYRENIDNAKDREVLEGAEEFVMSIVKTYGKETIERVLKNANDADRKSKGLDPELNDFGSEITSEHEHLL